MEKTAAALAGKTLVASACAICPASSALISEIRRPFSCNARLRYCPAKCPSRMYPDRATTPEKNQERDDPHKYKGTDEAVAHTPEETVPQIPEAEENQSGNNDDSVDICSSNEKSRQPSIKQERRNIDTDAHHFPGLPELPDRSFIWRQQDLFLHSGRYYTWIPKLKKSNTAGIESPSRLSDKLAQKPILH